MAELQMLKSILRGCLVSKPDQQLTVGQLNRDYAEEEGEPIPFKRLGFATIWDFLESIPDTLIVASPLDRSWQAIVRPVRSEKTAHVESLVKRQSSNKKRVRLPQAQRRRVQLNSLQRKPAFTTSYRSSSNNPVNRSQPAYRTRGWPVNSRNNQRPATRDSDELFIPASLKNSIITIIQNHSGITLSNLEVKVNEVSCVDVKTLYSSMELVVRSIRELRIDHGEVFLRAADSMCSDRSDMEFLPPDEEEEDNSDGMSKIPDKIVKRICDLLEEEPNGIWCSTLADQYQKTYDEVLEFAKWRYLSILQMLKSSPTNFFCKQIEGCDWKVFSSNRTHAEPFIPEVTVHKIEQLLLQNLSGMDINNFPLAYEEMYAEIFDYAAMNYGSLVELFSSMSGIVQMSPLEDGFTLYPAISVPSAQLGSVQSGTNEMDHQVLLMFPEYVVGPDYDFPRLVLPSFVRQNADIEVIIAAVINIDRFHVQLRSFEHSKKVDELEERMRSFYQQEAGKFRVPVRSVMKNLYCVANVDGDYNRLKITRINNDDTISALHIDYGNIEKINIKALHFMHKDFARLPGQAIQCRCANLIPPNQQRNFDKEAGFRLLELVKDKGIVATIAQVFSDRLWLWVSLVDTTGHDDIHINDKLVDECRAEFFRDTITTGLLRLCGISVEEFQKEMEAFDVEPFKDLSTASSIATYMNGSIAGSVARSVTGSVDWSVTGSVAGSVARSVTQQDCVLPSRVRRSSPICPPLEELEKSFTVQAPLHPFQVDLEESLPVQAPVHPFQVDLEESLPVQAPVDSATPLHPLLVQLEKSLAEPESLTPLQHQLVGLEKSLPVQVPVPAAGLRPPPGFRPLANPCLPADVVSVLAEQSPCDHQNITAPSQLQLHSQTATGTSQLNIASPPFIPKQRYLSGCDNDQSVVSKKLPSELAVQQLQYAVEGLKLMTESSSGYQGGGHPESFYQQPVQSAYQPAATHNQNKEYQQTPYMPTSTSPYTGQQEAYITNEKSFQIYQALNLILERSGEPPAIVIPPTPQQKEMSSHSSQTEDAFDAKVDLGSPQTCVDGTGHDGGNLTDEAKTELMSPESNTSLDIIATKTDDEVKKLNAEGGDGFWLHFAENGKSVVKIAIGEQDLHMFHIDGKSYMEVKEVIGLSNLKVNVALKILRSKEVGQKFVDIKKKTHGHIFDELSEINDNSGLGALSIQLVPIENVVDLLNAVNAKGLCLIKIENRVQQIRLLLAE